MIAHHLRSKLCVILRSSVLGVVYFWWPHHAIYTTNTAVRMKWEQNLSCCCSAESKSRSGCLLHSGNIKHDFRVARRLSKRKAWSGRGIWTNCCYYFYLVVFLLSLKMRESRVNTYLVYLTTCIAWWRVYRKWWSLSVSDVYYEQGKILLIPRKSTIDSSTQGSRIVETGEPFGMNIWDPTVMSYCCRSVILVVRTACPMYFVYEKIVYYCLSV